MTSDIEKECLLNLEQISYHIDDKTILKDISFNVGLSGGITGIIGPSGAGKSTILRLINRLISPTSGTICFNEEDYSTFSPRELRKKIGLVQQRAYLFQGTVRYNLLYGPKIWGIEYSDEDLIALLIKAGLSEKFLNRDVANLSEGEKQRASLARSLANEPQVLLLDEPTSALDIVSEEIIENTLVKLAEEGLTILIVTHSLEQTERITDQVLLVKKGKIVEKTATKVFFKENDKQLIKDFFKEDN
ncbi:MAG: phosphate ABC transporter ATP-binding protein [Candidatus Heimdallarchaeota archaeon]|nr:phosphate ABC transporter ATP-binding protein [Candidatus Heimdallarchaeota archaeon]MCK5049590.1 phosphate ABC transporter ATP-binding protein [Candidatus Heimdallarchaeota archaeon]